MVGSVLQATETSWRPVVRPFPSINNRAERPYLLAYWRYLLGWQECPDTPINLAVKRRIALRRIARSAIHTQPSGPAKLLAFPQRNPSETQK